MELKAAITNHIKKIAFQEQLLRAVVLSVDKPNRLCVVKLDNGTEIDDILIQPISGYDKGLVIYPKQGSRVILEKIEAQDMALKIASYTEIDEIGLIVNKLKIKIDVQGNIDLEVGGTILKIVDGEVSVETPVLKMDCSDIVINGGGNEGLVKVGPLLSKLNAIENLINNHTHLIISPTSGSPTSSSPVQLPLTSKNQIMNPIVKH